MSFLPPSRIASPSPAVVACVRAVSARALSHRSPSSLFPPPPALSASSASLPARLYSEDGSDYQLVTQSPIPGGSTVIYVPAEVVLSSERVVSEFGGSLQQAENVLVQMDKGTKARLPLFRLMVKILAEYDAGPDSPFYPWLNSLPRQFYNGVSMTEACFACLPPYAGWLVSGGEGGRADERTSTTTTTIRDGGGTRFRFNA